MASIQPSSFVWQTGYALTAQIDQACSRQWIELGPLLESAKGGAGADSAEPSFHICVPKETVNTSRIEAAARRRYENCRIIEKSSKRATMAPSTRCKVPMRVAGSDPPRPELG